MSDIQIKFCPECGTPRQVGSKFCSECGFNFSAADIGQASTQSLSSTATQDVQALASSLISIQPDTIGPVKADASQSASSATTNLADPGSGVDGTGSLVPPVDSTDANSGIVILVSQQGDGDFRTISEALSYAAPGARVVVRKGMYAENLFIRRAVTLVAEDGTPREQVIVASDTYAALSIKSDAVTVRGMSFIVRRSDPYKALPNYENLTTPYVAPSSGTTVTTAPSSSFVEPQKLPSETDEQFQVRLSWYWFDTLTPDVVVFVRQGSNVLLENCVMQCQGDRLPTPPIQRGVAFRPDDVVNLSVSMPDAITVRGCLILGGDVGIELSGSDSGESTVDNCEIAGFSRVGIIGPRKGNVRLTHCNIHDASNSRGDDATTCGISLDRRSDVSSRGRPEATIAVIESCEIHNCGRTGIDISYICERGGSQKPFLCDESLRVKLIGCNISRARSYGIVCRGSILDMETCILSNKASRERTIHSFEALA